MNCKYCVLVFIYCFYYLIYLSSLKCDHINAFPLCVVTLVFYCALPECFCEVSLLPDQLPGSCG